MLSLTPDATAVVTSMRRQRGLPDSYGLRIYEDSSDDGQHGVRLGFSAEPVDGDEIAESEGTRVFVDPAIAPALEDTVLDTEGSGDDTRLVLHPA
jgi:iron-sulfur cluster assembly protein